MRSSPSATSRAALLALLLALPGSVRAGPLLESERHYRRAVSLFQAERYDRALAEFQAAYDLVRKPLLLYNIAQCHRRLGRGREALAAYERYLASGTPVAPPMRAKVEAAMAEARRLLEAEKGPPPGVGAAPRPDLWPARPPLAPAALTPLPLASAPAPRPLYRRWWLWTVLGAAAAGTAVAVAVPLAMLGDPFRGVAPDRRWSPEFPPPGGP